jgi:hypothetical protein
MKWWQVARLRISTANVYFVSFLAPKTNSTLDLLTGDENGETEDNYFMWLCSAESGIRGQR